MTEPLAQNTQAILLLVAPLLSESRRPPPVKPLSLGEYKALAGRLRASQLTPAELIGDGAAQVVARVTDTDELCQRVTTLLARGFLLSEAIELWASRSIWVMSRADAAYPERLKARFGQDAPPVLYGCGDKTLLARGGVAVVGSRDADAAGLSFSTRLGRAACELGVPVVSGGARGVDQAGVAGALDAGGKAIVILPDSLGRAVVSQPHRQPLREQRLVLVSQVDPLAAFNVGHAMQRNKLIYALADIAIVASSAFEAGGTWAGATEQLERLDFVPIYARGGAQNDAGPRGLIERGALTCPEPLSVEVLRRMMADTSVRGAQRAKQQTLAL